MDFETAGTLLLLLMTANGAPILARKLLHQHGHQPIDGGYRLRDGKPLFGASKTWRGLVAALLTTEATALTLNQPLGMGLHIAALAMTGDLLTSFIKRRLHIAPSAQATGLDQIPESLLPLLGVRTAFALDWTAVLVLTAAFVALDMVLSRLLFALHIRKRPY